MDGWREYSHSNTNIYQVYYNQYYTYIRVSISSSVNIADTFKGWHDVLNNYWIQPKKDTCVFPDNSGTIFIRANNTPQIQFKSVNGTSFKSTIHDTLLFPRNI